MKAQLNGLVLVGCLVVAAAAARSPSATPHVPPAATGRVMEGYGKLPLSFEVNRGQTDAIVEFFARGNGYTLFLTSTEAVVALQAPAGAARAPVRLKLAGAARAARISGLRELPGRSHYLIGNDPAQSPT